MRHLVTPLGLLLGFALMPNTVESNEYFDIPLEQLLDIKVSVSGLVVEDEITKARF